MSIWRFVKGEKSLVIGWIQWERFLHTRIWPIKKWSSLSQSSFVGELCMVGTIAKINTWASHWSPHGRRWRNIWRIGLPICFGQALKSLWNPIIKRLEKNLSIWKSKYLPFSGQVIFKKAVASNLPIHFSSLFKWPVAVIKCIEDCNMNSYSKGRE